MDDGANIVSPYRVIGGGVRRMRERRGLTIAQLAAAAGIPHEDLVRIEGGHDDLTVGMIEKVAGALGLPLVQLIAAAYGFNAQDAP